MHMYAYFVSGPTYMRRIMRTYQVTLRRPHHPHLRAPLRAAPLRRRQFMYFQHLGLQHIYIIYIYILVCLGGLVCRGCSNCQQIGCVFSNRFFFPVWESRVPTRNAVSEQTLHNTKNNIASITCIDTKSKSNIHRSSKTTETVHFNIRGQTTPKSPETKLVLMYFKLQHCVHVDILKPQHPAGWRPCYIIVN